MDSRLTEMDAAVEDDVGDDLLRLIFTACHPVLSSEAGLHSLSDCWAGSLPRRSREPSWFLNLQSHKESFEPNGRLAEARVPFEVPRKAELAQRLSSVLEVIYLIFNEGYSATVGDDWLRPSLCEDALRLGRILA